MKKEYSLEELIDNARAAYTEMDVLLIGLEGFLLEMTPDTGKLLLKLTRHHARLTKRIKAKREEEFILADVAQPIRQWVQRG